MIEEDTNIMNACQIGYTTGSKSEFWKQYSRISHITSNLPIRRNDFRSSAPCEIYSFREAHHSVTSENLTMSLTKFTLADIESFLSSGQYVILIRDRNLEQNDLDNVNETYQKLPVILMRTKSDVSL